VGVASRHAKSNGPYFVTNMHPSHNHDKERVERFALNRYQVTGDEGFR